MRVRKEFVERLLAFLKNTLTKTKHGPNGRGEGGPCDAYCVKCEAEKLLHELSSIARSS